MTIKGIRIEKLPQDKGGEKPKGIVAFNERDLELVLNRTNAECLKGMFGRDTDAWIGKRVTFFPMPMTDSFTGERITAIRVRGSPDLPADKAVEVRLPRKKAMTMTMKRTGTATKPNGKAPPQPEYQQGEDIAPPDDVPLPTDADAPGGVA